MHNKFSTIMIVINGGSKHGYLGEIAAWEVINRNRNSKVR